MKFSSILTFCIHYTNIEHWC